MYAGQIIGAQRTPFSEAAPDGKDLLHKLQQVVIEGQSGETVPSDAFVVDAAASSFSKTTGSESSNSCIKLFFHRWRSRDREN